MNHKNKCKAVTLTKPQTKTIHTDQISAPQIRPYCLGVAKLSVAYRFYPLPKKIEEREYIIFDK